MLRFVGTKLVEQWGQDFTGTYWEERVDRKDRGRFRKDIERVCDHPVGLHVQAYTQTSHGRTVPYEALYLPLGVEPAKPKRCVRISEVLDPLKIEERKTAFDWMDQPNWIDIGAGIPK